MTDIAQCPQCGAKNRLAANNQKIPVCGRCRTSLPWMVNTTEVNFDAELASPSPVLVDLWAPWCGPCRMMAPTLDQLVKDFAGRLKVVKVNVDENPGVQARFQVQGIPTLLLFQDGTLVERLVGAQSKAALAKLIQGHL